MRIKKQTLFSIAVIVLCFAAFHNKYPLLTEDSGTFINAGFLHKMPIGGGLIYGMFVAHSSWGISLWITLFCQAVLTALVLYLFFKYFVQGKQSIYFFLAFIFICVVFIPGSIVVSTIDPGIFSALTILTIYIFLYAKELPKRDSYILLALIFLGSLIDAIQLLLAAFLMLFSIVYGLTPSRKGTIRWKRPFQASIVIFGAWLTISIINLSFAGSFSPFYKPGIQMLPRLAESGFVNDQVKESFYQEGSGLYVYRDSLEKLFTKSNRYLSPFLTQSQENEYAQCVSLIRENNKFNGMFVKTVLNDFALELLSVKVDEQLVLNDSVATLKSIFDRYNSDVREVYTTLQLARVFNNKYLNLSHQLTLILLSIFIFIVIIFKREWIRTEVLWYLVFSYVAYALLNSIFSGNCHYQYHISWLMVLPFFIWANDKDFQNKLYSSFLITKSNLLKKL